MGVRAGASARAAIRERVCRLAPDAVWAEAIHAPLELRGSEGNTLPTESYGPVSIVYRRGFERNGRSRGRWLVGRDRTYADLSAFQVVAGLRYAFPNAMAKHERRLLGLGSLKRTAMLPAPQPPT